MTVADRLRIGAAIAAMMLGATACGSGPGASEGNASHQVVIGHIAQLSGAAQQNGVQFDAGVQAALAEVNGTDVLPDDWTLRVVTEDDGTDIARSASLLTEMVTREGADAVLASGWTPISTALWPLANDSEVPLVTASSLGDKALQEDFFFSLLDLRGLPNTLGEHLVQLGKQRVGLVIDGDNPGFTLVSKPIEQKLKDNGRPGFVTTQTVSTSDTDFSAVLTNLADADLDAIVLLVGPEAVGNVLLQSEGIPQLTDVSFLTHHAISGEVTNVAGESAVGLSFPQAWIATDQADAVSFEEEAGTQASSYFAYGHDSVWAVAVAAAMLLNDGQDVTGEGLRRMIPDATGSAEFAARRYVDSLTLSVDGVATAKAVMGTFDDQGKIVPLVEGATP
ncbi:ABC transporter substrate-binding protein [Rhodococcus opacus]